MAADTKTDIVEVKQQLDSQGFANAGIWGGPQRKHYWTPDGREIYAIPALREFVMRDASGKIVKSGTRDANFDRGWLETRPEVLKPYCPTCDKWHDNPQDVVKCKKEREDLQRKWELKARKLYKGEKAQGNEVEDLKSQIAELKTMLEKLGGKRGKVFQRRTIKSELPDDKEAESRE